MPQQAAAGQAPQASGAAAGAARSPLPSLRLGGLASPIATLRPPVSAGAPERAEGTARSGAAASSLAAAAHAVAEAGPRTNIGRMAPRVAPAAAAAAEGLSGQQKNHPVDPQSSGQPGVQAMGMGRVAALLNFSGAAQGLPPSPVVVVAAAAAAAAASNGPGPLASSPAPPPAAAEAPTRGRPEDASGEAALTARQAAGAGPRPAAAGTASERGTAPAASARASVQVPQVATAKPACSETAAAGDHDTDIVRRRNEPVRNASCVLLQLGSVFLRATRLSSESRLNV